MADKFRNKYRTPSTRAPWHGYDGGVYFVTICTDHHDHHYFGEIVGNTHNGRVAKFCDPTSNTRPNMDTRMQMESVGIMAGPEMQLSDIGKCANECWNAIPTHFPHAELGPFVVMPNHVHGIVIINDDGNHTQSTTLKFGPQSRNLASIIRGFKIGVTKYAHANNLPFAWQARFYDRIVRDQQELNNIAQYIENNVINWANDGFHLITNAVSVVGESLATVKDKQQELWPI